MLSGASLLALVALLSQPDVASCGVATANREVNQG